MFCPDGRMVLLASSLFDWVQIPAGTCEIFDGQYELGGVLAGYSGNLRHLQLAGYDSAHKRQNNWQ